MTKVIDLAQNLVQYRSYSSRLSPVFTFVKNYLETRGFTVRLFSFAADRNEKIPGLYASLGSGGRHLLFSGHLDTAVLNNEKEWSCPPFAGSIHNGMLYARGICDMKGAVAGFISACENLAKEGEIPGKISLLLSGDEEKNGSSSIGQMMKQLATEGEKFDFCIFGSPSSSKKLGDVIKIGARGRMMFEIKSFGQSGHPAYHAVSRNPLNNMLDLLVKLKAAVLDSGNDDFGPSTLQVLSLRSDNNCSSTFPLSAVANVIVMYNTNHRPDDIISWMQRNVAFASGQFELKYENQKNAYYNNPEREINLLKEAVEATAGIVPACGTDGAATAAAIVSEYCPVVEFGLTGTLVNRINEAAAVDDIYLLEAIYRRFIKNYF